MFISSTLSLLFAIICAPLLNHFTDGLVLCKTRHEKAGLFVDRREVCRIAVAAVVVGFGPPHAQALVSIHNK